MACPKKHSHAACSAGGWPLPPAGEQVHRTPYTTSQTSISKRQTVPSSTRLPSQRSQTLMAKFLILLLLTAVFALASPTARQALLPDGGPKTACNLAKEACVVAPMPGQFCPTCDVNGLFEPLQSSASTGFSYCVNPITGNQINGTQSGPGQPNPTCTCEGMTAAKNTEGMALYCGPCYVNQTKTQACWGTSIGGYCPQCDSSTGAFSPAQASGGTGYMWCVNPATGETVNGTMTAPAESPKPECTCDWMTKSGNVDGQNAYCLYTASPPPLGAQPSSSLRVVCSLTALLLALL